MADVEISYNNSTIATMNDSGTEVLETNGKVCADDITIAYTKSGGGGSNWTKLASQEFTVNTTSTTSTLVGTIQLTLTDYNDPETVLWVHVRDKAGFRTGYFFGTDTIFFHFQLADNNTNSLSTRPVMAFYPTSSGSHMGASSAYGVFGYRLYYNTTNHYLEIHSRYSNSYGTINGTFVVDVYKLTMPTGLTLFG